VALACTFVDSKSRRRFRWIVSEAFQYGTDADFQWRQIVLIHPPPAVAYPVDVMPA
jgi:hypothetical protein